MTELNKTITVPNGSLVWKMGKMWGVLSPDNNGNYLKENLRYTPIKPTDMPEMPSGRGSFKHSFQIIGIPPKDTETDINMGWINYHISIINRQINVKINSGSDAAKKRWSMGIPHYSRHIRSYHHHNYGNFKMPEHNVSLPEHISTDDFTTTQRIKHVRDMAYWEWLRSEVYIRDRGICWLCSEFVILKEYELGHLIDRSNGGNDALDNCAVMHKRCNNIKPRHYSLEDATAWRLNLRIAKQPSS